MDEFQDSRHFNGAAARHASARVRSLAVALMTLTNLFDSHEAIFGTFNENRQTGELERFLTPQNARSLKLIVRRRIGGPGDDDGQDSMP